MFRAIRFRAPEYRCQGFSFLLFGGAFRTFVLLASALAQKRDLAPAVQLLHVFGGRYCGVVRSVVAFRVETA